MVKRKKSNLTFTEKVEALAQDELKDSVRVKIAKNIYLMSKKDELTKAIAYGYPYRLIVQIATEELCEMDIPKTLTMKNEKGEEITREVKFGYTEIKNFIEPKEEE